MNILKGLAGILLAPAKLDYSKPFSLMNLVLIVLVFFCFVTLACPPVAKYVLASYFEPNTKKYLVENKDGIKLWLNFVAFTLEILIAFAIGGVIFTEAIVNKVSQKLKDYQWEKANEYKTLTEEREKDIQKQIDDITQLRREISNTKLNRKSIKTIFIKGTTLFNLTGNLILEFYPGMRWLYKRLILISLITNFPGGLYGIGAFFLFSILSVVKLANQYLDSPFLTP